MNIWKPILLLIFQCFLSSCPCAFGKDCNNNNPIYFKYSSTSLDDDGEYIRNLWIATKIISKDGDDYHMEVIIEREEQWKDHIYTNNWNHIYDPNKKIYFYTKQSIPFTRNKEGRVFDLDLSAISTDKVSYRNENKSKLEQYIEEQKAMLDLKDQIAEILSSLPFDTQKEEKQSSIAIENEIQSIKITQLNRIPNTQSVRVILPADLRQNRNERYTLQLRTSYSDILNNSSDQGAQTFDLIQKNDSCLEATIPLCEPIHAAVYRSKQQELPLGDFTIYPTDTTTIRIREIDEKRSKIFGRKWRGVDPLNPEAQIMNEMKKRIRLTEHLPTEQQVSAYRNFILTSPQQINFEAWEQNNWNYLRKQKSDFFKEYIAFKNKSVDEIRAMQEEYQKQKGLYLDRFKGKISLENYAIFESLFHQSSYYIPAMYNLSTLPDPLPTYTTQLNNRDKRSNFTLADMQAFTTTSLENKWTKRAELALSRELAHTDLRQVYYFIKSETREEVYYAKGVEILLTMIRDGLDKDDPILLDYLNSFPQTKYTHELNRCHDRNQGFMTNKVANNFSLKNTEGKTVQLSDSDGKWRVLSFAFVNMDKEREKIQELNHQIGQLSTDKFQHLVVFLDWNASAKIDSFCTAIDLQAEILQDPGAKNDTIRQYIEDQNYTYLIDPQGRIQYAGNIGNDKMPIHLVSSFIKKQIEEQEKSQSTSIILQVLLAIAGVFCVCTTLLLFRTKRKQAKVQQTRRRLELELEAVRAQLNPHFIFNALGSIQHLVNKKENKKANLFLASFATLLRKVLQQSDMKQIPLQEELATVETYLSLESLRHEFQYEMLVSDDLDQILIEIPTMLIQPFVENAVLHGVSGMYEKGKIEVEIQKTEQKILLVSIRDNGKGYKQQSKHKGNGKGISLTEKRCSMLKQALGHEIKFETQNRMNDENEICGTEVLLLIPLEKEE